MAKKKGILPIFVAVLIGFAMVPMMVASAYASDTVVTVDRVNYALNDDDMTATVTGPWNYDQKDITILNVVEHEGAEYTVTKIGQEAFQETSLESVTFMPGSKLESIGIAAFYYCDDLKDITIPAGVKEIGQSAFQKTGLRSITFLKGSQLEEIGDNAFQSCDKLKSITIPASTKTIGYSAFYNSGLKSISIEGPSSLESIDPDAFEKCENLESIMIPVSVKRIGDYAFERCLNLQEVHYPGTQHDWDKIQKNEWSGATPMNVHFLTHRITKATPETYGEEKTYCPDCDQYSTNTAIEKPEQFQLSAASYAYDGSEKTPDVAVTDSAGEVIDAANYDVTYSGNVDAGTATATVTFKGDYYTGNKDLTFKINKAANTLKVKSKTATVKYKKLKKKTQTLGVTKVISFRNKGQGTKAYTKASGSKKITIAKKTGKVTVKKGLKKGTYKVKVKVKAAGTGNYEPSAWKTVTLTIRVK